MSTNEIMPKLKDFLCENLGIDADVLEFDTQLFGDGEIGLDSIDSLEIIAYVDDEFGVQMTGVGKIYKMWRVSDDFSGTRISYGYKLWLIAWMLLTDWTFRLEYCLQSPNGNARVDGLDFLVELDS